MHAWVYIYDNNGTQWCSTKAPCQGAWGFILVRCTFLRGKSIDGGLRPLGQSLRTFPAMNTKGSRHLPLVNSLEAANHQDGAFANTKHLLLLCLWRSFLWLQGCLSFRCQRPAFHSYRMSDMPQSIVMGVPQNGWFIRENPTKVDDWGEPLF